MNQTPHSADVEILVATMYREDSGFLEKMFAENNLSTLSVLVINQTEKGKELTSHHPNIRVINRYENGLSKSRNLALREAKGKYCLLADDDVVFLPDLAKKIKNGFETFPEADVISFMTLTTDKKNYWKYPERAGRMPRKKIRKILSVEIAFSLEKLMRYKVWFNEFFGLGAEFPNSANYLFLRELHKKNAKIYFQPEFIVVHPPTSSSDRVDHDEILYAQVACFSYFYPRWGGLFLAKYIFYLWRRSFISLSEIPHKASVGLKSLKKFKALKSKIYAFEPEAHKNSHHQRHAG